MCLSLNIRQLSIWFTPRLGKTLLIACLLCPTLTLPMQRNCGALSIQWRGFVNPLPSQSFWCLHFWWHWEASTFNEYCNSVFTTDDCTDLSSLCQSIRFYPKLIDTIKFTPENVYEELVNLRCDKACGPDSILAYLLKVCADFICLPLSRIFQLSVDTGLLPRDWTTANIVPIHKRVINIFPPITVP